MKYFYSLNDIFPRFKLSLLVGIIALLFSTALSGNGVYESLEAANLSQYERLVISVPATFFITSLAFIFWRSFGTISRKKQYIAKRVGQPNVKSGHYFIGGVVMSSISIITAFAALLYINNQGAVQQALDMRVYAAITRPLLDLSSKYAAIASASEAVQDLSAKTSNIENKQGSTCGPSNGTPPGYGPIAKMREKHAGEAAVIAGKAKILSTSASQLVQKIYKAKNQNTVDNIFAEALKLAANPERALVRQKAETLFKGYQGGGFRLDGKLRFCPDPTMASSLAQVIEASKGKIDIPAIPPKRRDANIFDAFAVVFGIFLDHKSVEPAGLSLASIGPLLIFAIIIDITGAISAFSFGRSIIEGFTRKEREDFHRTSWMLENFVWVFPKNTKNSQGNLTPVKNSDPPVLDHYFFIVPYYGDDKKTKDALYLAARYGLAKDPERQLQPIDAMHSIASSAFVERFRFVSGQATHFTVYPINDEKTLHAMMTDKTYAINALGFDHIISDIYSEAALSNSDKVRKIRPVI